LLEPKKQKTAKAFVFWVSPCSSKIIFRFAIKAVFAKFNRPWLHVQGFYRLPSRVAIHASNRQATFYGIHGWLAARQFPASGKSTIGCLGF